MVLISWLKEIKSNSACAGPTFPDHIRIWLLDLLACSDPTFPTKDSLLPYAELSRTYSKMRGEASQLLQAMQSSAAPHTSLPNLDTLNVDDAINLASRVPGALSNNDVDDMESAKQRLLSTSGYLKCVQVLLRWI